MVLSIYPWTLQLVRLHSVSNYTEQMRDFLILLFFFFWPAVKENLLVLFLVKKWWGSTNPSFTPELLIFSPSFLICFRLGVQSPILVGNICCQDLQGFYLQFILLTTSFRLLWVFFFFFFKLCSRKVHLQILGNKFKAKRKGRMGLE